MMRRRERLRCLQGWLPLLAIGMAVGVVTAGQSAASVLGATPALCQAIPASKVSAVTGIGGLSLVASHEYQVPAGESPTFEGLYVDCVYAPRSSATSAEDTVETLIEGILPSVAGSPSKQVAEVKGQHPGFTLKSFGSVPSVGPGAYSFTFVLASSGATSTATGVQYFKGSSIYEVGGGSGLTSAKAAALVKLVVAAG